ncbi:hypothetical protein BGX26_000754 [Mortierella sp. AD094]|nr:hypothetical protein BGX26_000754 [Mortierella sp. AD094]
MATKNPLDLPEIRSHVAGYLQRQDLSRCICVCKDWYESFLPFVWSQWTVKKPTSENILRFSHMATMLTFETFPKSFNIQYPKLHTLSLRHRIREYDQSLSENDPAILISLSPSIKVLELIPTNHIIPTSILQSASELPNLEKLVIYNTGFTVGDNIEALWRIFRTSLTKLKLVGPEFSRGILVPDDTTHYRIRKLKLANFKGLGPLSQLELISRCPQLEGLTWGGYIQDASTKFAQHVASGKWPNLKKLGLNVMLQDEEVEMILDGIKPATKLELPGAIFGTRACLSFERHFDSLTVLNLHRSPGAPSMLLRNILCLCPHLKFLSGKLIQAKDIATGEPWACLSLKTFRVQVNFDESEHKDKDLHSLVFGQFSRLFKLQELYAGNEPDSSGRHDICGLDFRLEYGLGQLVNLKKLRHLSFLKTQQVLEEEDAEWITNNLTGLVRVSGYLHMDDNKNIELRKILQAKNIAGC